MLLCFKQRTGIVDGCLRDVASAQHLGYLSHTLLVCKVSHFRHRAEYDEPMENPLPKLYHERRDESEKVRFAIPKKHDGAFKPARDGKVRDAAKSDNAE